MSSVIDEYRARLRQALAQLEEMEEELEVAQAERTEPIAVVGQACRFPGQANTPEAFFQLLEDEIDAVTEVPPDRWSLPPLDAGADNDERAKRWGAFIQDIDLFDASFFSISPREASAMDPQQRLLLELSWEALERAGLLPAQLVETNTGVFLGTVQTDYLLKCSERPEGMLDFYDVTGNGHCFAAGRLSYALGFNGPCIAVDTACSSSLVAIHLACQSLRSRESDVALAGGVNLMLAPFVTDLIGTSHGLSPDGRCKTFDASANGFVRGEGAGIVVLKRLSDAQRAGDPIIALIRGSAINQDGRSAGIAAPNVNAQEAVLRRALANARLQPGDIQYVELHGTGTPLGDPIEAAALRSVFGKPRPDGSPCVLGALKTNLAHLEAAAGVAGFMKAVLALEYQRIPKNLHFNTLNPRISLEDTPFVIPTDIVPWSRTSLPRRAGISSFGMSGTNAHIIVEEAPAREPIEPPNEASAYLLPLSAKTPAALLAMAQSYAQWFARNGDVSLADVVYTASTRRTHHEHRLAIVVQSSADAQSALEAYVHGETRAGLAVGRTKTSEQSRVVFVFPGQGSQWVGMGCQLLATEAAFRDAIEACDEAIRKEAGFSVLDELKADTAKSRLHEIDVVQPVLFAVEVSLAALWRSWGIVPDCVIGHSMGEVAAAHVAGMLSLQDAVKVICRRSKLLKRISGQGAMGLVELPMDEAQAAISAHSAHLSVAASNGPRATVLSGHPGALEEVLVALEKKGIFCRRVKVDVASHSPQVDPLLGNLLKELDDIRPTMGRIPMRSTVTGKPLQGPELTAAYWAENLRLPVRLSEVVQDLAQEKLRLFVELSPHPVLLPSIDENLKAVHVDGAAIASMRRQVEERQTMLEAFGNLYVHGTPITWDTLYPVPQRVVALPTYPWQRERFWVDAPSKSMVVARKTGEHPLLAPISVRPRNPIFIIGNRLCPSKQYRGWPIIASKARSFFLVRGMSNWRSRLEPKYMAKKPCSSKKYRSIRCWLFPPTDNGEYKFRSSKR